MLNIVIASSFSEEFKTNHLFLQNFLKQKKLWWHHSK